ncbi:C40 family peptidase [uncultured Serinicoccus sp.]|uniref:C40 family peptidase n=1 Tax=uncultured Serinicoccus sp. TaxID=735514 RepID=UPI00261AD0D0|nr:C40 family peptidase [uncultured Serinicoccus sp.]
MTQRTTGRHRRPGRLRTTSITLTRTAAVAATSTGLLAGAALSANAAPEVPQDRDGLLRLGVGVSADRTVTVDRPAEAVAAPSDIELDSFGIGGFSAYTPQVEVEEPVQAAPAQQEQEQAAPAQPQQEQVTEQVSAREETSASRTNERAATPEPAAPAEPAAQSQPEPAAAPAPTGGVLGIAAGLVGTPYQWGGSTPAGFDCSGFTSYVFAAVGISLPRTAAAQQAYATPVSDPQPGDLIFYGYPAYHIGIYAGNGMMYDSPRPGKVLDLRPVFDGVSGYGRVG